MAKHIIKNHTEVSGVERSVIVDTNKATRKWTTSEGDIDECGLYLSSKGKYYYANRAGANFVSKGYATAYLIQHDYELPEDLKELGKEIVE
jgi:hypothetical protein